MPLSSVPAATAARACRTFISHRPHVGSDAQESSLKRVVDFCQKFGTAKLGIQLAHAGRKGSTDLPWNGGKPISPMSRADGKLMARQQCRMRL